MREINFRAWDIANNRLIYIVGLVSCNNEIRIWYFYGEVLVNESFKPSMIIIEQFTGLRDAHGKEIYEGDIIQDSTFKDRGSYIMAVEWEKEAASFVLTRNGWAFRHYFYESSNPDDCEVIGNIHEHSHLLK